MSADVVDSACQSQNDRSISASCALLFATISWEGSSHAKNLSTLREGTEGRVSGARHHFCV